MVTHDAGAAATADRVLFLADGQIVDHHERPDARGDPRPPQGARDMIGLALRGLTTRKLRSALTAIAVLLGVAMITGTYVLTDQIRSGVRGPAGLGLRRRRRRASSPRRRSTPTSARRRPLDAQLSTGAPGPRRAHGRRPARRSPAGWSSTASTRSRAAAGSWSSTATPRAVRPDQQPRWPPAHRARRDRRCCARPPTRTTSSSATPSASTTRQGVAAGHGRRHLRPGRRVVARRDRRSRRRRWPRFSAGSIARARSRRSSPPPSRA